MNTNDARVRYTKMVIENVFLELLKEKPYTKITVKEICDKAQINRSTFYKHYLDVPDLLNQLENNLFEQIDNLFNEYPVDFESFLLEITKRIKNKEFNYNLLGSKNGDNEFMNKLFKYCYDKGYPLMKQNLPNIDDEKSNFIYTFLSAGSGSVLNTWLSSNMKMEAKEVVDLIMQLCEISIKRLK